jgi:type I restriction enzyme, R subunit
MIFTEDSRVKIPCILHLVRLGYQYTSLKSATWDEETNIFPELFLSGIARMNPGIDGEDNEWHQLPIPILSHQGINPSFGG